MENIKDAIPSGFWERMKKILGEDYDRFYQSYTDENVHALRLNPLKCDERAAVEVTEVFCGDGNPENIRVPWCENGFYYDNDSHPGKSAMHEMGLYYIQEPSAMLVGSLLDVKPGEKVLDLCAAPGGKTTHIVGMMKGEGILVSNEIDAARAKILSRNVERMGIKNCIVTNNSPDELSAVFCGFFDRIVVDSPCSGEGMFKKEEAAVTNWSENNVAMCAERSKSIVDEAVKMLAPGGVMVYSTCTFAPEEDEYIIKYILEKYPFMKLEAPGKPELFSRLSGPVCETEFFSEKPGEGERPSIYRIWPHIHKGEGHFAARLVKSFDAAGQWMESKDEIWETKKDRKKSGTDRTGISVLSKKEKNQVMNSLEELIDTKAYGIDLDRIRLIRDNLWLVPKGSMPDIFSTGVRTVRTGTELGTMKKDRFEPAHALAMTLAKEQAKLVFETDRPEVFLEGNTLACDPALKGWVLVTYRNCPLGFGKASGGVIKNHYPKGLRRSGCIGFEQLQ